MKGDRENMSSEIIANQRDSLKNGEINFNESY